MRLLAFTLLVLIAGILLIEKHAPPKTGVGGDGPQSARTLGSVYAAPTQVKLVDVIPASLSGETNQDSEPFLAVQTANPQVMVASAFTPNPVSSSSNAPIYVSEDGGNSWILNAITPVPRMTCDITHAMRSEEHTSELQSPCNLVCRLLLEKKNNTIYLSTHPCLDLLLRSPVPSTRMPACPTHRRTWNIALPCACVPSAGDGVCSR